MRLRAPFSVGTAIVALCLGVPAAGAATKSSDPVAVIVEGASVDAAAQALNAVGATVDVQLPIAASVSARVTSEQLAALDANPAVRVAPDVALHPTSASFGVSDVDVQV